MAELEDLFEQMERDELSDATKMSVADFAKLMGVRPQLIHYYIRNKVLTKETCICGRPVVDRASAEQALQTHQEGRRGKLDTRDDEQQAGEGA